jgi:two-component system cell cycle sensor histidine kinase/response regulator CckA
VVLSWLSSKRSEAARLAEAAFEASPLPTLLVHADGDAAANAAWRRLFGDADAPAPPAPGQFAGDGAARTLEGLRAAAAAGQAGEAELRLAGEEARWVRLAVVPLAPNGPKTAEDTQAAGTMWTAEDVSAARRYRPSFDDAPVGVVLLDLDGRIEACNRAFADGVGLSAERAAGRTFAEFVAAGADKLPGWLATACVGTDAPPPLEVKLKGQTETEVALFAGRISSTEGRAAGLVVHVTSMSAQKTLEAQFFQSQKMELIGQLAGGIAHDFNNLLTAMIGFCDLLLLRHSSKDQSFGDIMQIKQNANRAANLVRQLLAFSRRQTLQPKVLNLTDVLAELSHLLQRLIGANIQLKLVHGRDLGLVKVDHSQFEQVVINLAVNARDAMERGGVLTIRTGDLRKGDARIGEFKGLPDADYVFLEVADTGCGIPEENLTKIFEPFFTTKPVGSGTGLGLATVYGIVNQTGGQIHVSSKVGVGTTFTIFLPRVEREAGAAEAAAEAEAKRDLTGAGTVLLVEDEDAVRRFGVRALQNKGYKVIEARDGEDALEVLGKNGAKIDLVITDVMMPGVDGPTLIRRVRETHPDLKVIFISGYAEDSFRKRLGEGEQVHFLPKPFSLQQLAGKVKEVMHASG